MLPQQISTALRVSFGRVHAFASASIQNNPFAEKFGQKKAFSSSNPYPPPDSSRAGTADLCDVFHPESVDVMSDRKVKIAAPIFKDFGGNSKFSGKITTVLCYENNPLVRKALEEPGQGRVLVVDGGASLRCALLGDQIAAMAVKNGWSGILINGCIRDSEDIGKMDLGVKALATFPLKSSKRDPGLRDVPVTFAGVTFTPGHWLYADKDGVLVSPTELKL
mmetsp:Transcript_26223/g.57267  ORF Transcript_26223/g.57267 Transcript_26223/m.57267 type:complete len:221 (+) Transcript_26223:97-759(+)|eukprot:CAMPEP_0202891068 /NCGR_PEP_ID=MMETSP1392-20130828/1251_1 /ASSEMBLY_ACC=CAM_ASM_000868 /TAXON_ID=225041 /ORGANISM="Chlamydomonas chlamydogama, Strain SAG 11-48b" /LENGTH=220 /DNA_ID=CAMNT_0049574739 /DNA_START=78 /DNA_END=740 /DNA_ORIENTATION=+